MKHDWMKTSPDYLENESYECKRCGSRVYYYEQNVPCMCVTRTTYWDAKGKMQNYEPPCAETESV